ncbi:4Fe-4S binding protein [uncultured Ilyobacter sp.]|jgi:2-oxoglutarate ferredoxin oxidoreductase subunit delta|uniref:4Fe-4S dicluster domain-containing protein n=1 Tax=uncultured Ilyobacter sp. TaxID=544433 RepID=UPI0029BFE0E7|nr:4Fe-4S binding protein [uncultured Ilyobacter sp.]
MEEKVLVVKKGLCKGCEICVEFCPKDVLDMKDGRVNVKNISACIQCNMCGKLCPDYAIGIRRNG